MTRSETLDKFQENCSYHFITNLNHEICANNSVGAGRRLAMEIQALSDSLPLTYGSSIFLRWCEENINTMKALIIGPENTPYENEILLMFVNQYIRAS